VARGFKNSQNDVADRDLVAIAHSTMGKESACLFAKNNFGARSCCEFTMAADEIRVQVGLNHILDFQTLRGGFINVAVDIALRIHDCSFAF
jgi:hypothetical protein